MSDAFFSNVSSLLHFDGADGSTTFTDEKGIIWTPSGDAKISTAQSKFGGASGLFDGAGDYVSCAASSDFDISTENLTFECFLRLDAGETNGFLFSNRGIAGSLYANWNVAVIGGKLRAEFSDQNTGGPGTIRLSLLSAMTLSTGVWHHVAVVRSGSNVKIYLNGVQDATGTLSANPAAAAVGSVFIGYEQGQGSTYYLKGWIDDLRITKGVARYTADFTPPTAAFPSAGTPTTRAYGFVS